MKVPVVGSVVSLAGAGDEETRIVSVVPPNMTPHPCNDNAAATATEAVTSFLMSTVSTSLGVLTWISRSATGQRRTLIVRRQHWVGVGQMGSGHGRERVSNEKRVSMSGPAASATLFRSTGARPRSYAAFESSGTRTPPARASRGLAIVIRPSSTPAHATLPQSTRDGERCNVLECPKLFEHVFEGAGRR